MTATEDPHHDAAILWAGRNAADAPGALILLHGRGGSAGEILSLGRELAFPELTLVAPQAANRSWYPYSFLEPVSRNEPWLSSALRLIEILVQQCLQKGFSPGQIVFCGFSQGACLGTEYVARHPYRYAALLAFTGGLIGPPEGDLDHPGTFSGMPALLSSGDPDPHVPWERVERSAKELRAMGARVEVNRYPGRPHTVLPEEVASARTLLRSIFNERETS